jgi:hypothetical protein
MVTFIALILSVVLQIIAFVSAIWLIRYAKNRIAWILIAIALIFMAIRRIFDLLSLRGIQEASDYSQADQCMVIFRQCNIFAESLLMKVWDSRQ